MPRLTNKQYLQAHDLLRQAWLKQKGIFGLVGINQQQALHDFFQPSKELTTQELVAHRKAVSAKQRSLPNRAGKAYQELRAAARNGAPVRAGASGGVRAFPIIRPEPDLDEIVYALMEMMEFKES